MLLLTAFAVALSPVVLAQTDDAQVIILVSPEEGGTTDPVPDTYNYPNGTVVVLTATANEGYEFAHWIIEGGYLTANEPPLVYPIEYVDPVTGEVLVAAPPPRPSTGSTFESMLVTQNPLVIVCGYGYTFSYKAVFITTAPTERSDAVVVVKQSAGGTTNPGPGTYTFGEGSGITLTATASDGYEFKYWTAIEAGDTGHPTILTENPLAPTCGIGYTYEYQPVFAVAGAGTTTDGIAPEILYAIIIILAIIAVIAIAAALMYRSRK
jgi:hypothetical protein